MDKRKALGRGLGALIPNLPAAVHQTPVGVDDPSGSAAAGGVRPQVARRDFFFCPIEEILPAVDNPRQRFDEQRLSELADSIRAQGLVQPLVVRMRTPEDKPGDGSFILIAGERRWRASQRAGLKDVPVVVKDVSAAQAFELALVENLQREDLNPIEEAEAYRRLSDEFGYTQEELSRRVGRERATVANALRLLKLPGKVRDQVATGQLAMGHARALLGLEDSRLIEENAEQVIKKALSVRQTEDLVRRAQKPSKDKPGKDKPQPSSSVRDVEQRLQRALGARVQLRQKTPQSGIIEVHYHSLDQLDGLLLKLTGEESD
ncbi:MAG TPA: ParB/RepB/Spo0J family partition protein [Pseudomonadota bacterium]|jgi:ParB family chromosome partitioning protein|nr:ParB/RepB/Spo0J family partition protein [Pseudomonadota bacterium]